jgi:glycosyltransferase involved in cell wall biosynthesis
LKELPKITVIVPCYKRPERTQRLIGDLLSQNLTGWEAFFIADCCPDFQNLIDSGFFETNSKIARNKGNALIYSNLLTHYGGYGYEIRNRAKTLAHGKYVCFVDNDDRIAENHLQNYFENIDGTDLDFAYFDSYINPLSRVRYSKIEEGMIGHSEIVIKTEFYKKMPPQQPEYGHDWKLISDMIAASANYSKFNIRPSYMVMGVGDLRETGID